MHTVSPPHSDDSAAEIGPQEQARMVDALHARLQAKFPGESVLHIETHISRVLVTPLRAYKFKKALDLGFLDFSTRARRLQCCEEELRLNRRLAPALYLGIANIAGTPDEPALDGNGPVIDHAVCMQAFSQAGLWDRMAHRGELTAQQLDELAVQLADFHKHAPRAPIGSRFGSAQQVRAPMLDNFAALERLMPDPTSRHRRAELVHWEVQAFEPLAPLLEQRRADGWVRECHGDLHLGNVADIEGRTTVFDCIEFNDDFRWIDVMSEVAFMAMDLHAHALGRLAHRFVDRWLQRSGDYGGLCVLRYYMVYRALVRAKVAALRSAQAGSAHDEALRAAQASLALAGDCSRPQPLALCITHGLSGSGKTTLTHELLEQTGAVRIRADVERKRLFGLQALARSASAPGGGLYTAQATESTYQRLFDAARQALQGGYPVVLDASFLQRAHRDRARQLAADVRVPFILLDFDVDPAVLRERVRLRSEGQQDASEGDAAVLDRQLRRAEPLGTDEQAQVLPCGGMASSESDGRAVDWRKQLRASGLAGDH